MCIYRLYYVIKRRNETNTVSAIIPDKVLVYLNCHFPRQNKIGIVYWEFLTFNCCVAHFLNTQYSDNIAGTGGPLWEA